MFPWIIRQLATYQPMGTSSLLSMKIHGQFMAIRVQNKKGTSRKAHYKIVEFYAALLKLPLSASKIAFV